MEKEIKSPEIDFTEEIDLEEDVKQEELTDDERKEWAASIIEESEKSGITNTSIHKDEMGGKIVWEDGGGLDWRTAKDGMLHMAGTIPSNQKSAVEYLKDAKEYDDVSNKREDVIDLSRKAAKYEGIVATVIEALTEIPTLGGWYIHCKDDELKKILLYWLENMNAINSAEEISNEIDPVETIDRLGGIEDFALKALSGLYIDGDYVVTEYWENVPIPTIDGATRNLPVEFISHDVSELEINNILASINKEIIYAKFDDELVSLVKSGGETEDDKAILENISPTIIDSINSGDEKFQLPSKLTTHFSRKNNDRTAWGQPFTVKAFPEIAYKKRLRILDIATIDGLIQRVWIIKVGTDNEKSKYHITKDSRVTLAVNAFKQLKTQNVMVWSGADLEVEKLESSDKSILDFKNRYDSADQDTLKALGVPRFLLDGVNESQGSSNDSMILAKTISQMERYQIMFKKWIEKEMRLIAVENDYEDQFPKFHWMWLKITNQDKAKNLVTKLYEDNLLGIRRSLHMVGLPADEIVEEFIDEGKEGLRDKLPENVLPYSKNNEPGRPEDTDDDDGEENRKQKPSDPDSTRDGK